MKRQAADRTRTQKWRAGTRRNKRLKNIKSFVSDRKKRESS